METPRRIFLQACGTCNPSYNDCKECRFAELQDVTWSEDKIFKTDKEYIRKDIAEQAIKGASSIEDALKRLRRLSTKPQSPKK